MGRIVINNFKDGGPMRIQNSQGNIVTVPDSHKRIIKKHIKDGNHHMVSALVNKYSNPEGMSDGQQYALGGGLQGAMSGVSAGAAFGPWGAAIGGVIGGVGGWLGEDSQKKAQAQQLASQQQMMQQQNLFPRDQNLYNPNYQNGGRIKRSSYPQEGLINQIPGGNMINMGQGSELAIGASHAQGGMQISSQAEIQGKEVLLDDQYVLTAEKGTDGKSSIAEVFTKNKGALSPRNDKSTKELGTNMLKQYAMQKNQDYLDQRNAKLHKAMQRTMMKYGGHINKYTHGTGFESVDENLNNQFD